jgi:hypothetical protein
MRQGQQNNNKRMRGRNRKGPNPLTRSYESNGPDVKVRGTALHIAEKYMQLARDAQSSGDRVQAENYLQHAEHYYRIVSAAQAQMPQPQQVYRSDADSDADGDEEDDRNMGQGGSYPMFRNDQQSFGGNEPQPYVNGNGQARSAEQPMIEDGEVEEVQPEPQPQPEARAAEGEQAPREGRREGFRPRRRRPYRERGERAAGGAEGGGEPQGAPAGGEE